jgi:hypothetical protein
VILEVVILGDRPDKVFKVDFIGLRAILACSFIALTSLLLDLFFEYYHEMVSHSVDEFLAQHDESLSHQQFFNIIL